MAAGRSAPRAKRPARRTRPANRIWHADNLTVLRRLRAGSVDLVYADPPFNTGRAFRAVRSRALRTASGGSEGFGGRRYERVRVGAMSFADRWDDYLGFLEPRLRALHRVLSPRGLLYLHSDWREVHYLKVLLDAIFGRAAFLNEVIWAYDYGGRARRRWPAKHDTLLVYAKNPRSYHFDLEEAGRVPYLAPKLVGPEKAARGKTLTDTWWHTIVPTAGGERTGYPAQKPVAILERIVRTSCPPGGLVLDPFAGSGTTGAACLRTGRRFLLIDDNPQALEVMARRFRGVTGIRWTGYGPE